MVPLGKKGDGNTALEGEERTRHNCKGKCKRKRVGGKREGTVTSKSDNKENRYDLVPWFFKTKQVGYAEKKADGKQQTEPRRGQQRKEGRLLKQRRVSACTGNL